MRIAQIAPLAEAVPPKGYGGTERVVWWLTEELVALGHDVTLFASGDSVTSAKLAPSAHKGLRLSGIHDQTASVLAMLYEVRRRADEFDIIHFHVDLLQYLIFAGLEHKCVTTLHGRLDLPDQLPIYATFPEAPLVSISHSQRKPIKARVNWLATVPHGLPASICPFNAIGGDYLAFLGRISPEKRPDRAIAIAIASGMPLKIAAKIDPSDQLYFDEVVKPLIGHPLVEFVGEIDEEQKSGFLANARALLFPIDWREPFGLVMIEAMSAGTPVIAWQNGSVPEVIEHGRSGYIVNSMEEATAAVEQVPWLPRALVRQCFEARFTSGRMARRYILAYEKLLSQPHRSCPEINSIGKAPVKSLALASTVAPRNVA